jgi:hypothetical protein
VLRATPNFFRLSTRIVNKQSGERA